MSIAPSKLPASAPRSDRNKPISNRRSERADTKTAPSQRTGLEPSTSTASRLSFLLTNRSDPDAKLSLPKSASSAAITSSSDFGAFPDFHSSTQPLSSFSAGFPSASQAQQPHSASESLRSVASSSTFNCIHARRSPQLEGTPASVDDFQRNDSHRTRRRQDSQASIASNASERGTLGAASFASSSSYRNPANLFLQKRSSTASSPSPTSENVTVAGRAADNKSHLTALGHASRVREQAATLKSRSKRSSQKSTSLPVPPQTKSAAHSSSSVAASAVPLRSWSTSASPSDDRAQPSSLESQYSDRSEGSATSAELSLQPRSRSSVHPRRRPQSFLLKPPGEPSNAIARQIGPRSATAAAYVPDEPHPPIEDSMSKRVHDEIDQDRLTGLVERSDSDQRELASDSAATTAGDGNTTVRQRKQTSASKRKTWFGFGRASAEPSEPAAPEGGGEPMDLSSADDAHRKDDDQRRLTIRPAPISTNPSLDLGSEEPPPPMDEAEEAFRASLGLPSGATATSSNAEDDHAQSKRTTIVQGDVPGLPDEGSAKEDSNATLRPRRSRDAERALRAGRRVTWFGWRGGDAPGANLDESSKAADGDSSTPDTVSGRSLAANDSCRAVSNASETADHNRSLGSKPAGSAQPDASEQSKTNARKNRGWLGKDCEVQEQGEGSKAPSNGQVVTDTSIEVTKQGKVKATSDAVQSENDSSRQQDLESRPSMLSLRGLWNLGKLPDAVEIVASRLPGTADNQKNPVVGEDSSVALPTASEQTNSSASSIVAAAPAGTASPWRWSLWRGSTTNDNETVASQRQNVEDRGEAQHLDEGAQLSAAGPAVEAMDVDAAPDSQGSGAPAAAATTDPSDSASSWTYSSYLASWVPTWVYNAQEEALHAQNTSVTEEAQPDVQTQSPPRTPAEQVKADALARSGPSPATMPIFEPGRAVLNQATRQGWISYFSSRSANPAKQLEPPPSDENGLEVMDISDISNAEAAASPSNIRPVVSKGLKKQDASNESKDDTVAAAPSTPASRIVADCTSASESKPVSIADSDGVAAPIPPATSKEGVRNLSKVALAKAANASAALTLGLGTAKKKDDVAAKAQPIEPDRSTAAAQQVAIGAKSAPNLVLPTFEDTFSREPRIWAPKVGVLERTLSVVNSYLFSKVPDLERMTRPTRYSTFTEPANVDRTKIQGSPSNGGRRLAGQHLSGKAKTTGAGSSRDKGKEEALKEIAESAQRLPRAWPTLGQFERAQTRGTMNVGKVVVIGVHGWFTQSIFKTMIGEPTGTSLKFASMQAESIHRHFAEAGLELNPEAVTVISLQGDGKVADRVDRLFSELLSRPHWLRDLAAADAVFLSAHSQGAIVATQLLARLVEQRHVRPDRSRVCLLSMCGIHHGPFAHLRSSITSSYINYFETAAAKELFEFQSSASSVSVQYTASLKIILDAGVKAVYVGSADDNVVPLYSALNASNSHPSILRALYIDGQAFPKVDFLTNLLVLCVAVKNAGLNDHNLLTLLSASVAGSLYGGTGHSKVYDERAVYDLATRYLFEVSHPLSEPTQVPGYAVVQSSHGSGAGSGPSSSSPSPIEEPSTPSRHPHLTSDRFEAQRWNPYELPWSLRGLFEDKHVRSLFAEDILSLLDDYEAWKPDAKNKTLKDLQWRLAPMRSVARPKVEGASAGGDEGETGKRAEGASGVKAGSSKL